MKATIFALVVAVVIIGGSLMLVKNDNGAVVQNANNVTIVDGKQIIEITAKGGYQPRKSIAKSGLPTVIRFETNSTFDCSSAVRIPSLNISKNLPLKGSTDIDIGIGDVGTLQGSCGMGMYPFEIVFEK